MGSTAHTAHDGHDHTPTGLRALAVLDEPQGHRHDVLDIRHHQRPHRRCLVGRHAPRAARAGAAVFRRRPHVQRVRHRPRPHHGVLHGDAGHDRRLRQLVRAADDRCAGHGLPAHEQHLVLAAAGGARPAADLAVRRGPAGRARRRCRLDGLCAAVDVGPSRSGHGLRHSRRCISPARRRSSAPSTSSPPSSTCARRA